MVRGRAVYGLATRLLCILTAFALSAVVTASYEADASDLIYSPWDKFCFTSVNNLCFVSRSVSLARKCNRLGAAVVLIERTGDSKKTLRVTVWHDVRFDDGVRVSIDSAQSVRRPFQQCWSEPHGCQADDDAGPELVDRLKRGAVVVIEATSAAGAPLIYRLPLDGFAQAYDGPPREPKVFEEQPKLLQEELQRRAEGKQSPPQEKKKVECEEEPK
jgi:invasion protein IalB